jgi:hypothetical protein
MRCRAIRLQPADLPFDTGLAILLIGSAGYFSAFLMAWMSA